MHAEPPGSAGQFLKGDGVVEVLRVGAVDGEHREVEQLFASGPLLRRRIKPHALGLAFNGMREGGVDLL